VVVRTVDVEIGVASVCFLSVWGHIQSRENPTVTIGAEDEITGPDGDGFDLFEKTPSFEDACGVWRDLNSGSNLRYCQSIA
jgi:hypothetical protein